MKLEENDIQGMLNQRRPGQSGITTQRKEDDTVDIISGVFKNRTTGAPITMIIWNKDQRSEAYEGLQTKLRPGHADYPAMVKYKKFNDYRGGGRFSGRLTATHVMGGAIARKLIRETLGIEVNSYTVQIGKIKANSGIQGKPESIYSNDVRCPDSKTAEKMRDAIVSARKEKDSLGGIIESVVTGLPVGLGDPVFGSLESDISRAVYSIPSVKGIEFGSGFEGSSALGSQNNDLYQVEGGKITTRTNNAGGILGGISNGMPITMRIAFKPASSIAQEQDTVDIDTKKPARLLVEGRHDPCVVPRAPPVVDALVSLVIADHALQGGFIKPVL